MNNRIPYIIGASSVALLLLIIIQVKWMQQSRNLIEAQFDQKVDMALCKAVDEFASCGDGEEVLKNCKTPEKKEGKCCTDKVSDYITTNNLQNEVTKALSYYGIHMDYELTVNDEPVPLSKKSCENKAEQIYTCSLNPLIDSHDLELNINFPGKQAYVLKQMGLMLFLSIMIMFFIISVFIYANYYLIKQKKLSERNKEFFNHMAHEFKTPLTNIGLASKMLRKKSDDPLIEIIKSENEELSNQVNKVLSMASLESGQFEMKKESINIKNLLDQVILSMHMQVKDKGGNITLRGFEDDVIILGDPYHISNAFRNLLENALKYNENVPHIEILGKNTGSHILVSIQDNGIGIEKENQSLVFDKFYRIQKSDAYQSKGFGLGLSYVKKIINLHNGDIKVFSEWQKGTRFDLKLPKAMA